MTFPIVKALHQRQRTQKNDRDGSFGEGGEQLLLQLTRAAQGYEGRFNIGSEQV